MVALVLLLLVASAAGVGAKPSGPSGACMERFATEQTVRYGLAEQFVAERDTGAMGALPTLTPFWVDMVNSDVVGLDGAGVHIAVLDTGLVPERPYFLPYAHIATDLGKGFSHDVKWDSKVGDFVWGPVDDDRGFLTNKWGSGHGTHVTSTITGFYIPAYDGPHWVAGVAPGVTIIPVLVLDTWFLKCPDPDYVNEEWGAECHDGRVVFNGGSWEMVAAGIYYAANLAPLLDGPLVITMSLGGDAPDEGVRAAIDYAISMGVIVIASAGNAGYAGMGWPGAYPEVISVGAAGWTQQWAWPSFWRDVDVPEMLNTEDLWGNNWQIYLEEFSSRPNRDLGQKPFDLDVVGPGASIVGPYKVETYWDGSSWVTTGPSWYYMWGTSMSAPHVAGISALVLQVDPFIDQMRMEAILTVAAAGLPFAADGAWVVDPWYGLYHFSWYGPDWGSGFLTADQAVGVALHR
jgi:subtilisin family serine protease